MRFEILGPVQVCAADRRLDLGPRRQRALLARLLVDAGRPVSVDRLVDDLWEDRPPEKVATSLQTYVSNLRRILEPDRPARAPATILRTVEPGYAVHPGPGELDAAAFEADAAACRTAAAAGNPRAARQAADRALARWRGPALADLADEYRFARAEAARLDAVRTAVEEVRLACRVDTGEHLEAIADLEALLRAQPLRERTWELLILALARAGRTAEALERHREAVTLLRDELGLEPGGPLRQLQDAILRRDPLIDRPAIGASATGGSSSANPVAGTAPGIATHGSGDGHAADAAPPSGSVLTTPPHPASPVLGRDRDVTAVADLLTRSRLVTVTGPGGVGKTALALAVVARARPQFSDGIAFAGLAALRDPDLVVPTIARALGLGQAAGDPLDLLPAAVGQRRLLVVLDNVEHLLTAAPDVAVLLAACPTVTVLATSRSPLDVRGEQEYPLPPLLLPDPERRATAKALASVPATRLFVDRVRGHVPEFRFDDDTADAVAGICRRLDGLPLAIELAAAWMRILDPHDLLGRLDEALPLLTGGPRDLPERQRTVRDTIAWSYDLLEPDEQRLFEELSVFRGAWTLSAAAAVTDPSGAHAGPAGSLVGHGSLVARSIVSRVPAVPGEQAARFVMLETIREYGAEQLRRRGTATDVSARHAALQEATADAADSGLVGRDQARWLDRIGREHDDLRAALRWYLDTARPGTAARIAWGIRWFWHIRGGHAEGRRWVGEITAAPSLAPTDRARADALDGYLAFGQGKWEEALTVLEPVAAGDVDAAPEVVALAASLAGHASVGAGDMARADRWGAQALRRYRDLGDHAGEGIAAFLPVQVRAASGDLAGADALLDEAERLLRSAGGPWGIAGALNIRVMIAQLAGRGADTLPLLHESIALSASLRDTAAFLYGLASLAEVLVERGDLRTAALLFGAGEALADRTGLVMQPPASRALYERHVAQMRAELDPDVLATAWALGRDRSLGEALADALAASA